MNRSIAAAALLITLAAPEMARAQGFGVKGGFSYGNVTNGGALPGEAKARSGFAAGIDLTTGGPIGIGIEGLYAQRGIDNSTAADAWKLDYIDVPLYLRLAIPNPVLTPFAYAGPQMSFELSCNTGNVSCPDTGRPSTTYAGVIGAGLKLGGMISLEGRYIYGLSDFRLNTITTSQNYRTRSFLILLGLGN